MHLCPCLDECGCKCIHVEMYVFLCFVGLCQGVADLGLSNYNYAKVLPLSDSSNGIVPVTRSTTSVSTAMTNSGVLSATTSPSNATSGSTTQTQTQTQTPTEAHTRKLDRLHMPTSFVIPIADGDTPRYYTAVNATIPFPSYRLCSTVFPSLMAVCYFGICCTRRR